MIVNYRSLAKRDRKIDVKGSSSDSEKLGLGLVRVRFDFPLFVDFGVNEKLE